MSKSKRIDLICSVGAVLMVLITLVVMCGGGTLITAAATEMPYVNKLFSTDKVHQIDIVADEKDWQNMLDNATAEEYISCTAVIDGEKYANVAIRPKGNSSLSTVASSDSDRYSFKIEFDHYDKNSTYHGLDKLCLNNAIQDNTYMKDYICYQMMNYLGADAPLSSFAWITVNGSDWGLYTAVEGIEDAYAEREYGSARGQIYKPDSMDMGGGGHGAEKGDNKNNNFAMPDMSNMKDFLAESGMFDLDTVKDFLIEKGVDEQTIEDFINNSESIDFNEIQSFLTENGIDFSDIKDLIGGGFTAPQMPGNSENTTETTDDKTFDKKGGVGGFGGMGAMGGSDDVLLVYTDDDPDSYPNIFDNAVFNDVTDADEARLISALKAMNEGDIENSVDVDEVLRYFAVHNFVLNEDSYTGSITHNYYLRENDGVLSMIAWDYNLAFGGMGMGGNGGATSYVNSPIDSPVTSGNVEDRPMIAWIFSSEEYTEMYHAVMDELITNLFESGEFEAMIDNAISLISPYVEKDPTAFCTYEEFETGVATLKEFCLLRAESIRGQLSGEIPTTSEGQSTDKSGFVDASHLTISDMGSQNTGMDNKQGFGGFGGFERSTEMSENELSTEGDNETAPNDMGGQMPTGGEAPPEMPNGGDMPEGMGGFMGEAPDGMGEMPNGEAPPEMPDGVQMPTDGENMTGDADGEAIPQQPENDQAPTDDTDKTSDAAPEIGGNRPDNFANGFGGNMPTDAAGSSDMTTWLMLGGSIIILLAGLLFAKFYK